MLEAQGQVEKEKMKKELEWVAQQVKREQLKIIQEEREKDHSQLHLEKIENTLSERKVKARSLMEREQRYKIIKNQTIRERVDEL